jgi:hypothetical protein
MINSNAGQTSFREGSHPRPKLYWLDIDVTFGDIMRQQRMASSRRIVRSRSPLQYSVLHGVGTVANSLSVGDWAKTFDWFAVDVAALVKMMRILLLPITTGRPG